jgi:Caspase domain
MRKALIIGIDNYAHLPALTGCVHDAREVARVLGRNADGTVNFTTPQLLVGRAPDGEVTRTTLRKAVRMLFDDDAEIALLYFAGHGWADGTGGFLCGSDAVNGDDGLALSEVMTFANTSRARNKVIVLDSCSSGIAGSHPINRGLSEIASGMTILTASTDTQRATETPGGGSGVFTSLLVDALEGGAANLVGAITPGSVYAHIDQSLGSWAQRPVFKTNVTSFVSLRTVPPPIALTELHALTTHFPAPGDLFPLDPTYEPERSPGLQADPAIPPPDPAHTATFRILQNYVKVNLLRPVGAPHMWHAAMQSKACELTALGQHYWRLVKKGLL